MRLTIAHDRRRFSLAVHAGMLALVLIAPSSAEGQGPEPAPFGRRGWNLELSAHAAVETWNYNVSHETMFGIVPGLTYGLRDGLVLTASGPLYFVDQRGVDAYLLGVTAGVRGRVYRSGGVSGFLEFAVGVSEADTLTPPRGTRFNYLALGGAGLTVRLRPSVHLLASLRWIHVSNNGLAGRSRNPDIEAVGPQLGVLIGF
jgi:Lipid A 3-O-deacylase (PagL)